jgi:uncharacterized membrane protein YfcA
MSPVGLALALLIGVTLGLFGGGGSILTVPLLVYGFGLDPKTAIASSLAVVALASTAGAFQHWRAGNLALKTASVFGLAGMVGAYAGGRISARIDGGMLLLLFAAVMIATSLAMWRGRRGSNASPSQVEPQVGRLVLQGLVVGSFTGLVGAGGGFLIVPALVLWAGMSMPTAVGTSLFIIVLNSLAGFAGYLAHVSVDPVLIGAVASCAVAGSFVGTQLSRRVDPNALRRGFSAFVLVMGGAILFREGRLVAETASSALPETLPQLLFVIVAVVVGLAAGRASRSVAVEGVAEQTFLEGEGI